MSSKMIHTYKRKGTSQNTCSFYERVWGDALADCSANVTHIDGIMPNEYCSSMENEAAKCKECSGRILHNSSNFFQSQPNERLEAPLIKFQYSRRSKELRKSGGSLHCVSSLPLLREESRRISAMNSSQQDLDRLCWDSYSLNHCIVAKKDDMQPSDLNRNCGERLCSQSSTKEKLDPVCSNISANELAKTCVSVLREPDPKDSVGQDVSNYHNNMNLTQKKGDAPLQTYRRRTRDNEDTHKTYASLMVERSVFVASDLSISGSAESLENKAKPKPTQLGESEVNEYSPSFYQSPEKLTDKVSSVGNMMCSQGNQKVRNGCQQIDAIDVSIFPTLNDEAVKDQPHDDAIRPNRNICDLSLHSVYEESSTDLAMPGAYEAVFKNSHYLSDKNGEASKDFLMDAASLDCSVLQVSHSDEVSNEDLQVDANTKFQETVPLESESLMWFAEINHVPSHAEDPKASRKELVETLRDGNKETNGLFDINVQPSKDAVSVSLINQIACPVESPTQTKALQLFPEDTMGNALLHNTSKSGLVSTISSNNNFVTVALPDSSVNGRQVTQGLVVESTCSQARPKLLQDSIRSCNRPQIEATEDFLQFFQPFSSLWSEEELDNLWVGVRRHGKNNWYALLADPRLRFSPLRTANDLAKKWIMEQTKLLGNSTGSQDLSAKPVGIPLDSYRSSIPPFVPPGPGFMTRFLTDPMQISLSNASLKKQAQGMFPPLPPQNNTNVPGNGSRLFNRRVRAHRKSHRSESTWGKFKVRNQVMPSPQFTSLVSTSRVNSLPSYFLEAHHYPHPLPPLPFQSLPAQHLSTPSQFYDKRNNKGIGSSIPNGTTTDCPRVAAFPTTQPGNAVLTDPKKCKELINLESDASSEGTISV